MNTNSRQAQKSRSAAEALTFNVAGLLGEPVGSIRDLDVSSPPLDLGPDLRQARDVVGNVRLTRTNRGLLVKASLATCDRAAVQPLPARDRLARRAARSRRRLCRASTWPAASRSTPRPRPDALRLTDHHELDLEEEVRDAILLAEPIAPLCREDCPGLCVVCGQELGSGPHDHPDADIDPRLEALRQFRSPDEN